MSGGFTFGNKTTTVAPTFGASSGGSITFGTPAAQPPQRFGGFGGGAPSASQNLFGTPQAAPAAQFKTSFGAATSTPGSSFGMGNPVGVAATPTGFGFGTGSTSGGGLTFGTPAASAAAPTAGLSFGGTPSFGTPVGFGGAPTSTALSFGTATTSAQPNMSFGQSAAAAPAPNFGAVAPSFGQPTPAAPAPSFGAPTAAAPPFGAAAPSFGQPAAASGLSFGAPATTSAPLGGLSFGAAATPAPSFGAPAASTGLSFGTATSAAPSFGIASTAPTTGLSFGGLTSTAPTGGLSFGGPTSTAPAPSFGTAITSTAAAPGLGLNFGGTSAPSLNFGAAPTTAATSGLGFGTIPASSAGGLSFGGFGGLATSAPSSTTLGLTTTQSVPQPVGLGGIASAHSKTGASAAEKEIPPKEQPLPNEFLQTVESFKAFVQTEKNRSSDVARCTVKEFRKVETDLDLLNHQFSQVENQLVLNANMAEQLKNSTAKGLQNIEMAQRTQETPPALQYENTAPINFFLELAEEFERELQILKIKIDNTEKFVKKWNEPSVLTSQDLTAGIRRIHETFVALAGRMQSLHNQVESQKETFLSLRKQAMKDNVNPFEKVNKNALAIEAIMNRAVKSSPPKFPSGPTPFDNIIPVNPPVQAQQNPPAYPTTTTGFGFSAPTFGTQSSLFKSPATAAAQPFQLNTSTNFQLQKPPTGNKRGKQ